MVMYIQPLLHLEEVRVNIGWLFNGHEQSIGVQALHGLSERLVQQLNGDQQPIVDSASNGPARKFSRAALRGDGGGADAEN